MRELTVGDHLDQYLITDLLARTAIATTFKGHDTEAGAPVCLKVPHLEYESDIVFYRRFEREESIGRRLEHRNIVRALEPRTKSRMYLVTEYIGGTPLRSLIGAGPLPTAQALDIACQLCEALVYLHAHGIAHRDLKPENVIVAADGVVKLLDFGIALDSAARRLTWPRLSPVGTPDYMAPEQIGGRRGDERCDIYAAGLILYEMLTGQLPFSGDSANAVMRAKTTEEPRPPTYFLPQLDPALSEIICKAIARSPRDRTRSAAQLLDRLGRPQVTDGRETNEDAAPEGPRHPGHPVVARLIAALVLTALTSLTWLSHRADPRGPDDSTTATSLFSVAPTKPAAR